MNTHVDSTTYSRHQLKFALTCVLMTLLVGIASATMIFRFIFTHQEAIQHKHYGESIARLAALYSTEPLFANDLISLQVATSQISKATNISSLTVHDVENRLLAESINTPPSKNSVHHSLPITQNNNIAGYVTVTTHGNDNNITVISHWISGFAILGALILLYFISANVRPLRSSIATSPTYAQDDNLPEPYEEANNQPDNEPAEEVAYLSLYSLHLEELAKNPDSDECQKTLSFLVKSLNAIATLYDGQLRFFDNILPTLEIKQVDFETAAFQALCCGQLILALAQKSPTALGINAVVTSPRLEALQQAIKHRLTLEKTASTRLVLDKALAFNLSDKINIRHDSKEWCEIDSLVEQCQRLLDNQMIRLEETLTSIQPIEK
ncbi:hypothetical protein [Marinibactrum halimedae]|uniref:Uncharacterized protein n=1 Tax=Marinibactrum halimedae TaxID=1444977 RepID=A0AA37T150_9GAMM|nr:hypothetical protein [Marinibactrum halimedae]MCD9460252.1 hypothetical protein [Marinibactrum halimedae]GLS24338.1 hypothetical protein GCM10007877_00490 [Marinibactrum halimedae]